MTRFQLRADVAVTPGVSSAKKVDGKWLSKKKAEMVAELTGKATVSDGALEDMTCWQLRAKAAATPGVCLYQKNADGTWAMKKKADLVADLTASASTSSEKATVSDGALEDMTYVQLLAKVVATPGLSTMKRVDELGKRKWLNKNKADMIADLTAAAS